MPTNQLHERIFCPTESRSQVNKKWIFNVICRQSAFTYLWCHEFGSTTESTGVAAVPHTFLAETIICDLDMAIQGQENVVKLQVTVDDAVLMEVLESQANLCSIEPTQPGVSAFISLSFQEARRTVPVSNQIGLAGCEA